MVQPLLYFRFMSFFVSVACALFFALMLSVPNGYSVGAVLLLVAAIVACFTRSAYSLNTSDKRLFVLLFLVAACQVGMHLWHGNPLSYLELPTRYALAIPVVWLMLKYPPKARWLFFGVALGALGGFALGAADMAAGALRASGFTGGIQFGNLSLMLGIYSFLAAVACWQVHPRQRWCVVLLLLCALAGFQASLWSGSRGGWIALPWTALVFVLAFPGKKSRAKILLTALLIFALAVVVALSTRTVQSRIDELRAEIAAYEQGNFDLSIGARLAIWSASADIYARSPVWGVSRAQYESDLATMVQDGKIGPIPAGLANTHNTFLELALYTGLPGLLSVLALFFWSACVFYKRLRSPCGAQRLGAAGGLILLGNYFIFSQTQIMLGRNNTLLFFLISFAVFWYLSKKTYQVGSLSA